MHSMYYHIPHWTILYHHTLKVQRPKQALVDLVLCGFGEMEVVDDDDTGDTRLSASYVRTMARSKNKTKRVHAEDQRSTRVRT